MLQLLYYVFNVFFVCVFNIYFYWVKEFTGVNITLASKKQNCTMNIVLQ